MPPSRERTNVIKKRECAVCGEPDLYPRCDHREYVNRTYVALDAAVSAIVERYCDTSQGIVCSDFRKAADFLKERFA